MVDSSLRESFHAFDKKEGEGEAGILPDMLGADEDRASRQVEVMFPEVARRMGKGRHLLPQMDVSLSSSRG